MHIFQPHDNGYNRTTNGGLLHIMETNGLTDHETMSRPLKSLIGQRHAEQRLRSTTYMIRETANIDNNNLIAQKFYPYVEETENKEIPFAEVV
ncbi:hypothetical protein B5M09_012015 [Aphanomyces astaci]|uniref:Uncharacterized protein n=1 Tax=Aphanomyces astaci TaxID=112090 RepID=A0A425DD38_APHAT|nr:hypothetical protein B5M09_012015 [Aphanomyces astaci]